MLDATRDRAFVVVTVDVIQRTKHPLVDRLVRTILKKQRHKF